MPSAHRPKRIYIYIQHSIHWFEWSNNNKKKKRRNKERKSIQFNGYLRDIYSIQMIIMNAFDTVYGHLNKNVLRMK